MTNFAEETSDSLLTLLIECLNSKINAFDPVLSPYLPVPLDTAIKNLPGILDELSKRSEVLPPLHCDAFGLPQGSTCNQLAQKIISLSEDALGLAVDFFQAMEGYADYLNVNIDNLTEARQITYEANLESIREELNRLTSLHQQVFR